MIKTIYTLAWILVAAAGVILILTNTFDAAAMMTLSLIGLGLVYAFALWAVTFNNRDSSQPEGLKQ
jgi:hypothetical protein